MLDDPGVGHIRRCVIHRRISLEIVAPLQDLLLKAKRPVLQRAQREVKIFIDGTGVEHLPELIRLLLPSIFFKELTVSDTEPDLASLQHTLHHRRIAADRDPLVDVIEIIVVKGKAHRKASYDESGQIPAVPAPLLLRIALDQFLVDITPDQTDRLLLEIRRLRDPGLRYLLFNDGLRLLRRADPPHFAEGIHVEGKIVEFLSVDGHGRIHEMVEPGKSPDIVPDALIGSMENMRPVLMDLDAPLLLRIDISGHCPALVDHQALQPLLPRLMGKYGAVKSCADDQVIIGHAFLLLSPLHHTDHIHGLQPS